MKFKETKRSKVEGHLDILIAHYEDEEDGEITKWDEILIHGNPDGLRSLAKLLIELAELDQEKLEDKYLPIGAREHYHLRPGIELAKSSIEVIVGRLDAKGTGDFYKSYIPNDNH